jgi:hypothetical protein
MKIRKLLSKNQGKSKKQKNAARIKPNTLQIYAWQLPVIFLTGATIAMIVGMFLHVWTATRLLSRDNLWNSNTKVGLLAARFPQTFADSESDGSDVLDCGLHFHCRVLRGPIDSVIHERGGSGRLDVHITGPALCSSASVTVQIQMPSMLHRHSPRSRGGDNRELVRGLQLECICTTVHERLPPPPRMHPVSHSLLYPAFLSPVSPMRSAYRNRAKLLLAVWLRHHCISSRNLLHGAFQTTHRLVCGIALLRVGASTKLGTAG